jgi:hypothetical protein
MQVVNSFEQGSDEWHEFRKKKISGTRLKGLYSSRTYTKKNIVIKLDQHGIEYDKKASQDELYSLLTEEMRIELVREAPKKIEFYELLADHLGIEPDGENVMDRGLRLEDEVAEWFGKEYNLPLDVVGCCVSDVDPRIINSPDRMIKIDGKYKAALEIKCLSRARHLQAVCENVVPDEFESQKIQYFVVNPDLDVLYFVFYDPRVICKPYHVVKVTRAELGNKIDEFLEYQLAQLRDLDEWVEKLSF